MISEEEESNFGMFLGRNQKIPLENNKLRIIRDGEKGTKRGMV